MPFKRFGFIIVITTAVLISLYGGTEAGDSISDATKQIEDIHRVLDALFSPPCETWELTYLDTCKILGPRSNAMILKAYGLAGYRIYHWFYAYADSGEMRVILSDIDADAAYCGISIQNDTGQIAYAEGPGPSIQLIAQLPDLDWYNIHIITYGCGIWDDDSIKVILTHRPPDFDLRVTPELPWVEYHDGHPDTGVWVYYRIEDIGLDPIPYVSVHNPAYFPLSCIHDFDFAYPISIAVYGGKDITCDCLSGVDYVTFIDTFYLEGEQSIVTVGLEPIAAAYNDCSELWNILVHVDPRDDFRETDENNNCSLVAQIGWYHHINGYLSGNDWNIGANALRPVGGARVYLNYGLNWAETNSDDMGYFEFWVPYSHSIPFTISAEMSIPGVINAYDCVNGIPAYFESGIFNEVAYYSVPIILCPNQYTQDEKYWDTVFDAAANVLFGIEDMNNFMSQQLNQPYSLPEIKALTTEDVTHFTVESGSYTIRLNRHVDSAKYYDRALMAELGHAIHHLAIPTGIIGYSECPQINHFPGFPTNESCAFVEGWSGFITAIVPFVNPWTFTEPPCARNDIICLNTNNIEINEWLEDYVIGEGQDDEGAVATILYDMYESVSPWGIDDGDPLIEPFRGIYNTLQQIDINFSVIGFADNYIYWVLRLSGDPDWEDRRDYLCQMLLENKIDTGRIYQCEWGYVCGDANNDGAVNVGDAVFLICYIFENCGAPQPPPIMDAGDANCDNIVNIGDVVYLISYIYRGGAEPCCP